MPLADYAHWNEEAPRIWYEEEGKHPYEPDPDLDPIHADYPFAEEDDDE
jgi:hypothetical protein